jgi:hypothetical protein
MDVAQFDIGITHQLVASFGLEDADRFADQHLTARKRWVQGEQRRRRRVWPTTPSRRSHSPIMLAAGIPVKESLHLMAISTPSTRCDGPQNLRKDYTVTLGVTASGLDDPDQQF